MTTAVKSSVPVGPHGDLIAELCGTTDPTRRPNRTGANGYEYLGWTGPGFVYRGPKGECYVRLTGQGRVWIDWLEDGVPQSACFEQRWERTS